MLEALVRRVGRSKSDLMWQAVRELVTIADHNDANAKCMPPDKVLIFKIFEFDILLVLRLSLHNRKSRIIAGLPQFHPED